MSHNSIKLQLNRLALAALFDTEESQVELSKAVVDAFVKNHVGRELKSQVADFASQFIGQDRQRLEDRIVERAAQILANEGLAGMRRKLAAAQKALEE